jgi:hypothetical protein
MKIETTITAIKDGCVLFETDVICVIDYKIDRRYSELEWWVDEYRVEGKRLKWDDTDGKWVKTTIDTKVPEPLAQVFSLYLDRERIEEKIREELIDRDDDRADHLRDMAMDR